MLTLRMRVLAGCIAAAGAVVVAQPEEAIASVRDFACTENQKSEVRLAISKECGGSGMAWVYCSWTGLWEMRAVHCFSE